MSKKFQIQKTTFSSAKSGIMIGKEIPAPREPCLLLIWIISQHLTESANSQLFICLPNLLAAIFNRWYVSFLFSNIMALVINLQKEYEG